MYAISNGQILGKITSSNPQQSLVDIEITIENKFDRFIVYSNESGIFYANHIPTGKYTVTIQLANQTIVTSKVPVYDNQDTELNVSFNTVSDSPITLLRTYEYEPFNKIEKGDVVMNANKQQQPTKSLSEALEVQRGVDFRNGKLFIKGSDNVKFFIDGTPILGSPSFNSAW